MIKYISTRSNKYEYSAAEAIIQGIAPDGGLFVPTEIPTIDLSKMTNFSYQEVSLEVLYLFFSEFSLADLEKIVNDSYGDQWDSSNIVEIKKLDDHSVLELFHGPTLAFKDIALQVLPRLLELSKKTIGDDKQTLILTATSGDTGGAALAGFKNVKGTKLFVYFPSVGVSDVQRQQMTTIGSDNTRSFAISGNFDDAQTSLKQIFNNNEVIDRLGSLNYELSSANSINIGRLVPQIAYYIYSYLQLQKSDLKNKELEVIVPTGNFGNMLAAFIASKMGIAIKSFVVASNQNNVLTDFFQTGVYDANRDFQVTLAPAMDILYSSNLERLLYLITDGDFKQVNEWMKELNVDHKFTISSDALDKLKIFKSLEVTNDTIKEEIAETFKEDHYLLDPHTAIANFAAKHFAHDNFHQLVVSTAHPFKFPGTVLKSLQVEDELSGSDELKKLSEVTGVNIPKQLIDLFTEKSVGGEKINRDQIINSLFSNLS